MTTTAVMNSWEPCCQIFMLKKFDVYQITSINDRYMFLQHFLLQYYIISTLIINIFYCYMESIPKIHQTKEQKRMYFNISWALLLISIRLFYVGCSALNKIMLPFHGGRNSVTRPSQNVDDGSVCNWFYCWMSLRSCNNIWLWEFFAKELLL